jgi:hypothetical protein
MTQSFLSSDKPRLVWAFSLAVNVPFWPKAALYFRHFRVI